MALIEIDGLHWLNPIYRSFFSWWIFPWQTGNVKQADGKSYWCVLRRVAGWVAGGCWELG